MTDHPGEALSAYLDDELDPTARAAVEAHLAACVPCRDVVDDLRRLRTHAAAWATDTVSPSDDLWAGVAARLEPPVARPTARVLPWHQRRWSLGRPLLGLRSAELLRRSRRELPWPPSLG